MRDHEVLRGQLHQWLADRVEAPVVSELETPSSNGTSSETVFFEASWFDSGVRRMHRCALRLPPDPGGEPLFPDYDMSRQYRAMELVGRRTSVPVPALLWLETETSYLGSPFIVMERIAGLIPAHAPPYTFGDNWLFDAAPVDQHRLQDRSVEVVAGVHTIAAGEPAAAEHRGAMPGRTALRRHVQAQRDYYRWVVRDGARSPLLERAFDWLVANWPNESKPVVSWGDASIENIIYRDFEPVAVLDWEMAGLGPRELDLGWMIYRHRVVQDLAEQRGTQGMPEFMVADDVVEAYARVSGYEPSDLRFFIAYAALRHGIIRARLAHLARRGDRPTDSATPGDDDVVHHQTLADMLDGSYWRKLW